MKAIRALLPLVLVTAAVGSPLGQAPAPLFRAGVDVVEMDVTVLDKDRKPVRGLTAKDFTVLEDGKPRTIVAFTPVDIPGPSAPAAAWMRDVTPDVESNEFSEQRLVAIVIDDALGGNTLFQIRNLRESAERAIAELGPDDQAAVIFSGEGWNGQAFTKDRSKLRHAVSFLRPVMAHGAGCAPLLGSTGALRTAVEALAAIPHRRKVILFISPGGRVALQGPVTDPVCEPQAQLDAQQALTLAQRGNVNIYGISPSGCCGSIVTDKRLQFLDAMSSNTGGRAVMNTNEPAPRVTELMNESQSYYLLGYELASAQADGLVHRLDVKVNREGVEVLARRSRFDAKPPDNAKRPPPSPTDAAIGDFIPNSAFPIEVTTAPFATATEENEVEIALGVRLPRDTPAVTRDTVELEIRAFTVDGREISSMHESDRVELPAGDPGFTLTPRVSLKPGRYSLRIAVRSTAAKKAASVYTDVVVPDFTRDALSASGVIVSDAAGGSLRGDALRALTPMTTRAFAADDRVQAFLRLYQKKSSAPAPVTVTTRIVNDHNVTVKTRTELLPATAFAAARQTDYAFRFPCADLAPGAYWWSFQAAIGTRVVTRDVKFTIRP